MVFSLARPVKVAANLLAGQSSTVTLTSPATAGNLLVVALGHRRSDASTNPAITGTGSADLVREFAFTDNTGGNKGVALFWKIAAGGETQFISVETQQWRYLAVAEFEVPAGASGVTFHDFATATANAGASSLTVNVPNPVTTNSLAWVSSLARESDGTAVSFDSGFAAATSALDFAVSWRHDAQTVAGNNVTATYNSAFVSVLGSGVWIADGLTLAVPAGFAFTATGLQLDGSWTAVAGADTYDWEIERDDAGTWVAFDSGSTATLAFQVTTAVAYGKTYRARVRTDDGGVKSDWTGWLSASTPADALAIVGVQTEAVTLTWTANTGPYDVRRDGVTLIAEGLAGTTFVDTDVSPGTTYSYEVRSNAGPWSTPFSVAVVAGAGGPFFLKHSGAGWTR